jgi:hypothetical protein
MKKSQEIKNRKRDTEHKDFDSFATTSEYTMDNVASKDVNGGFASSVQKLRLEKIVPSTSNGKYDETIQNYNIERTLESRTFGFL